MSCESPILFLSSLFRCIISSIIINYNNWWLIRIREIFALNKYKREDINFYNLVIFILFGLWSGRSKQNNYCHLKTTARSLQILDNNFYNTFEFYLYRSLCFDRRVISKSGELAPNLFMQFAWHLVTFPGSFRAWFVWGAWFSFLRVLCTVEALGEIQLLCLLEVLVSWESKAVPSLIWNFCLLTSS